MPLVALVHNGDAAGKAKMAGALANVAKSVTYREAIVAAGGVVSLVALMHKGDAGGKANAARVLVALVSISVTLSSTPTP